MKQHGILVALLSLSIASPGFGVLTFNFNYTDAAGTGFNDVTNGAARKAAFELAASNFADAFSAYTATVTLDVDGTASGSTLAFAGSNSGGVLTPGFGLDEVVRNKVLSNGATDLNGGTADGFVGVNWGINWELDIGSAPSGSEYDWYSTMYHEFAHALGFGSSIFTDDFGGNATDINGNVTNGVWGKFDQFLVDESGNSLFTGNDLQVVNFEADLVAGPSPGAGLFFQGTNQSTPVGLYTPTMFSGGSSLHHLNDENAALAGNLMLATAGTGPGTRTFSLIEQNIFKDIGYTSIGQITAIPEPSALVLFGCFFLVLGRCRVAGRLPS